MALIPNKYGHAALERAGQNIVKAAGADGITSRKDVKNAVKDLPATEAALTLQLFHFIERRDAGAGNRITKVDVDRAVEYAKVHLLDKYDLNENGFGVREIAKMSKLGKLAMEMAIELRKTGGIGEDPTALATAQLGQAIDRASRMPDGEVAMYMSEGDYPIEFLAAANPQNRALSLDSVFDLFGDTINQKYFDGEANLRGEYTVEISSAAETREGMQNLATPGDPTDDYDRNTSAAFGRVMGLLNENLSDVRAVRIGPKDEDGRMATDQGLYVELLIGKTRDGHLAGVSYGSVET
ncbi:MAG: hypothetical protein IPG45_21270 [Deltaproteobacteria bacterium]|nr:hypothetical protein [Deltaproteobacteria bacterium]